MKNVQFKINMDENNKLLNNDARNFRDFHLYSMDSHIISHERLSND